MAQLPALIPDDPTFAPTRAAAQALLIHLEEVYTDRDWAHAPDVRRALTATLAWLDAVPKAASVIEAVGMGPVWAAAQALVQRLSTLQGLPGWSQDPAVRALVQLAGTPQPQSMADLRSQRLPLAQVAAPAHIQDLPRLARAWAAHLQTLPYLFARLRKDRTLDELHARELAHPAGYLAAFLALTTLTFPDRPLLAVAIQEVTPPEHGPRFPLGGLPVLPSPTVPVFIWLDLMGEALTRYVETVPPQRDSHDRSIVLVNPLLDQLKAAITRQQILWQEAVPYATAQRQAGYDLGQNLAHLGSPVT